MAKIIHKKSAVVGKLPTTADLEYGELALNYADGKLFYKASNNSIQSFGGAALSNVVRQQFTATAGQTNFTVTYTPGQLDVYLNGVKLVIGTDYTASSGTGFTLATAADAGDVLDIVAGIIFASSDWQYITNKPTTLSGFGITDGQPLSTNLTSISGLTGTAGFLKTNGSGTFSVDQNTYITGNQNIVFSGDATGNGTTSVALTLANSGVTAGTYTKVTVDAKGRVTTAATLASADLPTYTGTITNSQVTTALGFTPYNSTNPSGYISGNQSITFTGDATGTGATSVALTLANSGVTAGTYTKVTVDAKGRVTTGATLASADLPTYTGTITSDQVTTGLGYTPVNKAGDTMTGNLNFSGTGLRITGDFSSLANNVMFQTSTANGATRVVTIPNGTGTVSGFRAFNGSDFNNASIFNFAITSTAASIFSGFSGTGAQLPINISVGATNAVAITTAGVANFPVGLQQGGNAVLHAGNYNSYAPTLTGSGASGTWGISVTGSSNTTSRVASRDIRIIAPNSENSGELRFGFTSWANNNTDPWADYLHLRSYTDSSGGSDNLIMFRKNGIGMRIWQQTWGSSTAYASSVDVLHSSNYNSYALPLSGGTLTGAVRGTQLTVGGSTNTDANLGVQGASHLTGTVYWGGTVGNVNSWSSLQSSSGGVHTLSTSQFIVNRSGYGGGTTFQVDSVGASLTGAFNSSGGYANNDNGIRIANPGGASYSTGNSTVTGAIKIRIPAAALGSNTMVSFRVRVYQYSTGLTQEFVVAGYNYSDANATWYNVSALNLSDAGGDFTVRFGKDATSQCIYIGELNSSWSYPQVHVTDFSGGYSGTSYSLWATGWNISFESTAFQGVTNSRTAWRPYHGGNYSGLTTSNYSSYALPLSGGVMSGHIAWAGYNDTVNGSSWYGLGRTSTDLLGTGTTQMQLAGYYGLRLRTASAIFDMNLGSATFNQTLNVTGAALRQGNNLARPLAEWSGSGATTGMVYIELPGSSPTNYGMIHAVIDVYEYDGNAACTIVVGGHNWNGTWYNTSCDVIGSTNKQVRLAVRNGKFVICLGTASSTWNYGTVMLRKIHNASFYNAVIDMGAQFVIAQTTSEGLSGATGDLRATRLPTTTLINGNQVLHAGNYSSYALPLSGGTVSGSVYLSANAQGVGASSTLRVNGDITAARGNGTTGVIYLGNSGSTYVYWDGGQYHMPSGQLDVGGNRVLTAGNYTNYITPASGGPLFSACGFGPQF